MAVTGQVYVFTQGSLTDGRLFRINSDTTGQTIITDNSPTADLVTQFPQEIGVDTAAGRYFALVNGGNDGTGASLVTGLLSGGPATVLVNYGGADPLDPFDDPIVNALQVDVANRKIYVGVQAGDGATPGESGVRVYDYVPATGAVSGGSFLVTAATNPPDKPQENGYDIFDPRDFALDPVTGNLFFSEMLYNPDFGLTVNGLWRVNTSNPASLTEVTNNTQFPDTGESGLIGDVEVDRTTGWVYFTTTSIRPFGAEAGDPDYSASQNAVWRILDSASGGTALSVPLSGLPVTAHFYPVSMALDPQTRVLYITSEESDSGGAVDDVIYGFQLNALGTAADLLSTVQANPQFSGDQVNFGGMAVNVIPVLSGLSGTTTHAVEQSPSIQLLTAPPSLTDIDGTHLNSATVAITAGGSAAAGDDVLSATTAGTGITATYNAATETLTLSGYDTLANYRSVLASVRYASNGDNPTSYGANTTRTITWTVSDGAPGIPAGSQNSATTTVTVDAVNDAPVNTVGAIATVSEDAVNFVLNGVSIFDPDANPASAPMTVTLSVLHGTISLLTDIVGGVTVADVTGNGSATVTITSTQNAINQTFANSGLRYTPTANFNGTADALHIVTSDGGALGSGGTLSDTDDKAIAVTAVNDAPVVSDATQTLANINEDQPSLTGTSVNTAFATSFDDAVDSVPLAGGSLAHAFAGVAIVGGTTSAAGNWQYHDGSGWVNIGAASTSAAVLFSVSTAIRFNPAGNYSGPAPTLSVHLVDGSGPGITNASVVNLSAAGATGGTTRYSAATVSLDQTVLPSNDAPTSTGLSGNSASWTEGGSAVVLDVGGDATIDDIDSTNFAGGSLAVAIAAALPQDGLFIGTLGTVTSTATTVSVGGVQIATYTGGGFGGGPLAFTFDADATPAAVQALIRAIQYNNNAGDTPSAGTRTVNWTLVDGDGTANGGADTRALSSSVVVTAVNDAPVNSVPGAQTTFQELNLAFNAANGNLISVGDADAGNAQIKVTLSAAMGLVSLSQTGGLSFFVGDGADDAAMTFSGTVSDLNAALAGLLFKPTPGYVGSANITITVDDGGASGTGGAQSDSDTIAITVLDQNQAPTSTNLASDSASWTEGGSAVTLDTSGNATIADVNSANFSGGSLTVAIAGALPQDGLFIGTLGTVTSTATTVSVGGVQIATYTGGGFGGGPLVFTFDADATPAAAQALVRAIQYNNNAGDTPSAGTRTVNWTLVDGDGTANGGTDTLTLSSGVVVDAVNDAPVASTSGGQAAYTENSAAVAIDGALLLTDVDSATLLGATVSITGGFQSGQDLLGFTNSGGIVGSYNQGTGILTLSGSATVASYQAALRSVTYTNLSDTPETTSRTITFVANDGISSSLGATRTVTITAVNDAPVNTVPGAQSTNEDSALVFSSGNGNLISLGDVDAGTNPVQVTLTATNGATTLSQVTGLSFTTGDGTADATMTFTGRLASVNAALSGLSFRPTANFNGAGSLQIVTSDQGNSGSGGARTDSDTIAIAVNAVNDAPTGADKTVSTSEDTAYAFAVADFGFADANDTPENALLGVKIVTLPGAGTLLLSGAPVSAGDVVAPADIASGKLSFAPAADANGTGYASFTFQVRDNGGSANGGVDLDPSPNTITVDVTAVNDAPVNTVPGAQSTNEDAALVFSSGNGNLISLGDVDAGTNPVQVTLTATNGATTLSQVTGLSFTTGDGTADATMTFTGSLASVNAALSGLSFRPTANFNGAGSLQIVTSDQGNSGSGGARTDSDTIAIAVNPVNDAPTGLSAQSIVVTEDHTSALVPFGALDLDGDTLAYAVKPGFDPAKGAVTLLGAGFRYRPFDDVNGSDSFVVLISDGNGGVLEQTVNVTITPVNDDPVAKDDTATVLSGKVLSLSAATLLVNDIDVDGGPLSLVEVRNPANGTVSLAGGTVTFTPTEGFVGDGGFDYLVSDGLGGLGTAHVKVAVLASNLAPTVTPASQALVTLTGTPRIVSVKATDADGDPLTYVASAPSHGTISGGANGVFSYTPAAGYLGTDTFTVTVSDGKGGTVVQTETIQVVQLPDAQDWRMFASDGFVGEIGGSGRVFATAGFQDITVLDQRGTIDFDGSFNRGGDIVRLDGVAADWSVSLSGSRAVFTDGDSFVVLPVGIAGMAIGFDDGIRSLRADAATLSGRIGAQSFGSAFVQIDTLADGTTAPGDAGASGVARLFMAPDKSATIGGDFSVFGTVTGNEQLTVNSGEIQLDGSFNRGGDTVVLPQLANTFQASVNGSTLFLDGLASELNIPIGTNGLALAFTGGDSRTLAYDAIANDVLIGTQLIDAIPITLTNFA